MGLDMDFSELEKLVSKLANPDPIARKMIQTTTNPLKRALKARAPTESGEMKKSIRPSPIKNRGNGYFRIVRPTGKNSRGFRNMEIAAYYEFGNRSRRQPPRPFIASAVQETKSECLQIMQDVFDSEVI